MSTSPAHHGSGHGAERRRYVRLPIKLDALVAIDGRPPVPCTVRDFCVAGIFVAISQQQLRLVKPNGTAALYFSLIVDGLQKDFQLTLTIFRVVGGGFGCGFDNADQDTIDLLQALATEMSGASPGDGAEDLSGTQARFSPKFAELKQPLLDLVSNTFTQICTDFSRAAEEKLFVAARDAKNNLEETHFVDGQNEMRGRSTDLIDVVPGLVLKGVETLNNPLAQVESSEETASTSELSLVDKAEFEEFLTVAQLVSELEPRFKDPLYDLEQRFSVLANREVTEQSNPLGPTVVCGAFAEALKNLRADRTVVNVIYRSLGQVLENRLERLYGEANGLLISHGVLPVITKETPKIKRNTSSSSQPRLDNTLSEETTHDPLLHTASAHPYAPTNSGGSPHHRVQAAPAPRFVPHMANTAGPVGQPHLDAGFEIFDPGSSVAAAAPSPHLGVATPSVQTVAPAMPPGQWGAAPVHGGPPAAGSFQPMGLEATFGGLGSGGHAVYLPPSLQQAYAAAQTQMALRRDLFPGPADNVNTSLPSYAPRQVIDGLTQVQRMLAHADETEMLDVHGIKERIAEAIKHTGGGDGIIGQVESDAIEIVAKLFDVLFEDALLPKAAKRQLTRLQAPVHKAALLDQAFFEATDHPVRQLLNRVSMVHDMGTDDGHERLDRVDELVDQINQGFGQDFSLFGPIVEKFDQILREQRDAYEENVADVVRASEEQQQVLSARRDKNLEATSGQLQTDLPEEWNRWLDRAKLLEVGEKVVMNANTKKPYLAKLGWIGPEFNPYVFVDDKGDKSASLTLQQVAMYLRRGTMKQLHHEDGSAVDRALVGVVNRMHGEVEAHATHDELTDFMNRKSFLQAIERYTPETATTESCPVLCQIAVNNLKSINDSHGVAAGDKLISATAAVLNEALAGKSVSFGRLSGAELGVLWHKGGLQDCYSKLKSCFDAIAENDVEHDGESLRPDISAGITSIEDGLVGPEQLLSVVNEACKIARAGKDQPIHIVGSENKYREQLEQMASYVGKAYDRGRLVLLHQFVRSLVDDNERPAMHIVTTAEDRNAKLIPPNFFKQALSSSERAFEIDQWTLKNTFAWMTQNADELDSCAAVIIPLSHAAVNCDELANIIINELMETAVPPGKIFFEISDKDVVDNIPEVSELVRTLKEFGCRFVLDEFGSGQGNYDYVKEVAVDFVTIQTDFIADAKENPKDYAMAKSINELVHFMGMQTIGKQEPRCDVSDVLRDIGVDFIYDQSKTNRIAA